MFAADIYWWTFRVFPVYPFYKYSAAENLEYAILNMYKYVWKTIIR